MSPTGLPAAIRHVAGVLAKKPLAPLSQSSWCPLGVKGRVFSCGKSSSCSLTPSLGFPFKHLESPQNKALRAVYSLLVLSTANFDPSCLSCAALSLATFFAHELRIYSQKGNFAKGGTQ